MASWRAFSRTKRSDHKGRVGVNGPTASWAKIFGSDTSGTMRCLEASRRDEGIARRVGRRRRAKPRLRPTVIPYDRWSETKPAAAHDRVQAHRHRHVEDRRHPARHRSTRARHPAHQIVLEASGASRRKPASDGHPELIPKQVLSRVSLVCDRPDWNQSGRFRSSVLILKFATANSRIRSTLAHCFCSVPTILKCADKVGVFQNRHTRGEGRLRRPEARERYNFRSAA